MRRARRAAAVVGSGLVAAAALASAVSFADAHPTRTGPGVASVQALVRGGPGGVGEGPWPCVGGPSGATVRRVGVPAPGDPRAGVLVVTPPGASATAPVVYLLHGYPDGPASPLEAGLACSTRGAAGAWPAFVLAVPDGTGWHRGDHEWADAADGSDQLETWLTRSVVPAVEGEHLRAPADRTLAGFSMGAYGAVDVGLHHPDEFRSLIGVSGYYGVDDPQGVFGGDAALERANTPLDLGAAGGPSLPHLDPPLRVALVQSDDDEALVDGQGARMAKVLRGQGVAVREREGHGGHSWAFVADRWPLLMTWAARSW